MSSTAGELMCVCIALFVNLLLMMVVSASVVLASCCDGVFLETDSRFLHSCVLC